MVEMCYFAEEMKMFSGTDHYNKKKKKKLKKLNIL